ncbi:MAG: hypothetical protein JKX68_02490 [Flavobacteriales bacterium]|nr:hypothetical protein [Flavobacteriales bacterium]
MLKSDLKNFDHIVIGLTVGLIVPVVIMHFILEYYSNFSLMYLIKNPMFSPVLDNLKGALFANLGIFFLFYWLRKDKSSRGVVFATFIYGAVYMYYKFFM